MLSIYCHALCQTCLWLFLFFQKINDISFNTYNSMKKCFWQNMTIAILYNMERLSSFQAGYTKLEQFLLKHQHNQRKLLSFENWVNGEVSKSAKIWLSRPIFYVKNYPNLSQSFKYINLGSCFLLLTFFENFNF